MSLTREAVSTEEQAVNEQPATQWETAIQAFEAADRKNPPPQGGVLFLGSSSIAGWSTLERDFPKVPVLNRGFGGSQISDSVYYTDRIVLPYAPRLIVFYAGDNDLASGKTAEQVDADFRAFARKVWDTLPATRIAYISTKPSPSRWHLIEEMQKANALIAAFCHEHENLTFIDIAPLMLGADGRPRPELYQPDNLHMTRAGYKLWIGAIAPYLEPYHDKINTVSE